MRPDILIIGGGPVRDDGGPLFIYGPAKAYCLIEKENFGGQIADSPRVENYPFPESDLRDWISPAPCSSRSPDLGAPITNWTKH
jgi:thioredoxin reductase